ncbi:decarboxylating cobalt-precorrin-6B (C(15))-methyltransferase [Peptacetobacter sp.]|uniref:decarboxylating cobalt-precorrin-6B (C(15))-methyltransferase n=1 Tax=Peptacetobacter sp. TaxID=2991975 RepID=UPI0026087E0F|nr:decarboxylating cobalt-precorrin-6B (C(15))-methyltransferase [Peptacetobacter sp.]
MKNSDFIIGKVPITKEEVRSIALSKLDIENAKKFMDIGAGTGSISIEAALKNPSLEVTAVERHNHAIDLIEANKNKFSIENIKIIEQYAPFEIDEKFDAIFIGGTGKKLEEIMDWVYEILNKDGKVCANFIIMDTFYKALEIFKNKGFKDIDVSMISISKLEKLGSGEYFKPQNPIFLISAKK